MNPRIKQLWIQALKSGEYQQTKGTLRDHKGYCCLGVLTDLYIKENKDSWTERFGSEDNEDIYYFEDGYSLLPKKVAQWAGIFNEHHEPDRSCNFYEDPDSDGIGFKNCLPDKNDNGKTFEEIADIIEKYF